MTKVVCRAADKPHAIQFGGCWFDDMPATAQTTEMVLGRTAAITVTQKYSGFWVYIQMVKLLGKGWDVH